ncbi:MAG: ABC transporter permease [Thermoanaerobaculia bacterium]
MPIQPDDLGRELRHAARALRRSPIFTLTSLLTLAVCIGANTALFSIVDAVLLRPLPYPSPDRLGEVMTHYQRQGTAQDEDSHTGRTWFLIRDNAKGLAAAVSSGLASGVNFAANGQAEYVQQERVGAGFFRVLGVAPLVGREFSAEEDRPGGPAVAVLSHHFWQRVFRSDPSVVGRVVMLRGEPHVVVGVMPPDLVTTGAADLWTPLQASTGGEGEDENYRIIVRLLPGTAWSQAAAQIAAIGESALKERRAEDPSVRLTVVPLQKGLTEELRAPLLVLWAAAGTVLLIGCVNIASLLLARAAGRSREIATRLAIGAGRAVVLRQLLAESLLLAVGGGLGGLLLGYLGLRVVKLMAYDGLHLWQRMVLDGRVLTVALLASLLTSLVFGLLPALQISRTDIRMTLGESGRGATDGGHRWTRRLLVIAEVALGVVLLVSAGLLLRTFLALQALHPGFDASHVITAQLSLQDARYATSKQVNRLFSESLDRIRALPGIEGAAIGLGLPYERHLRLGFKFLDGPEAQGPGGNTTSTYVTPDYFSVLRIPLVHGRLLRDGDGPAAQKVAVVNEAFVRRYLPDGDSLGRHIKMAGVAREIVGVIGDIQQDTGGSSKYGPLAALPAAFFPAAQVDDETVQLVHTWFSPSWVVRTAGPPEAMAVSIQRTIEGIDPLLPIARFRTMQEVERRATGQQRFQAILLATLAVPALLLAALGIYSLIASAVVERTREVGIRLALGATRWQTMRAVALPGIVLALVGVLLGCALARIAVQSLQHLIWGVRATDPGTFAGVAVGLLLVATAASILPTLRLARINPATTLRND